MSQFFIYPFNGRPVSSQVQNGTISDSAAGGAFTNTGSSVTNPMRLFDDSIGTATDFPAAHRVVMVDKGASSVDQIDTIAFYSTSSDSDGIRFFTNNAANNSTTSNFTTTDAVTEGWNILSPTAAASEQYYYMAAYEGQVNTITELLIGKRLNLTNVRLAGTEGANYGNTQTISHGGVEFSSQKHDKKRFYNFDLTFINETYKTSLETMRDSVDLSHHKFLYYDGSEYIYVRMSDDSLQFTEVAFGVYDTKIKLTEQLS
tara:strand:+ start:5493 stop:6269 length:777 start_codon:yes stop_codon:yes gene_type:complete